MRPKLDVLNRPFMTLPTHSVGVVTCCTLLYKPQKSFGTDNAFSMILAFLDRKVGEDFPDRKHKYNLTISEFQELPYFRKSRIVWGIYLYLQFI